MAGASLLLWVAAVLGVAGVAVLRAAWSRPKRSVPWNAGGWLLLLASVLAAGMAEGAWGIAITAMAAMAAAIVLLAAAGLSAPPGRTASSNRRVGMLPERGEPRRLGRRFGTFGLVILLGFAVSIALATSIRGLGELFGWGEANANALALFATPLVWAILCTVLLMQTRRRSQAITLLVCTLPVLPVLVTGALS